MGKHKVGGKHRASTGPKHGAAWTTRRIPLVAKSRVGRSTVLLGTLLAAAILFVGVALAVHDLGLLELDRDATGTEDWSALYGGGGTADAFTGIIADIGVDGGTQFQGGGSKDNADISSWLWKPGEPLDKDDITNAYAAAYVYAGAEDCPTGAPSGDPYCTQPGDVIVYFGLDRFANNGSAQVGFWFLQSPIGLTNISRGGGFEFSGAHVPGDILVQSNFSNGGVISNISVFEWVGSGGSAGTLDLLFNAVECIGSPGGLACATVNRADTPSPWPFTPKFGTTLTFPAGSFFEGGLNISALVPEAGCFTGFLAETRSSTPFDSRLKDFALGEFDLCGSITVVKDAIPDDAQDFDFDIAGPNAFAADFLLDDDAEATLESSKTFGGLEAGAYQITETLPVTGWNLTDVTCAGGPFGTGGAYTPGADIELSAGDDVTCTFTNTKDGKIIVEKQTLPDGDSATFDFTGDAAGTIGDGGTIEVDVAPGQYDSTETVPAGWELTSIVCDDGNSSGVTATGVATFNVEPGETVTCTFTNTKDGKAEVSKTVSGGDIPVGVSFTFQVRTGASDLLSGVIEATMTVDSSTVFPADFGGQTFPPGDYQLCETGIPLGWTTDLFAAAGAFVPDLEIGAVCVSFTLDPGETESFVIDNTPPPEGCTLTQGYWKTHADPAKDKKYDDTWDLVGPLGPGELFFDTGMTWIEVLSTDPSGGNAYFILAHQYIAAYLNSIKVDNPAPLTTVLNEMADAYDLLDHYDTYTGGPNIPADGIVFSGTDYGNDRAMAIDIASTLDLFNNGDLPGGPPHCGDPAPAPLSTDATGATTGAAILAILAGRWWYRGRHRDD